MTLDGRSTAAVLASLVDEVAGGSLDGYAGQGLPGGAPDTFATLELTPTGEGVGVITVNVQGRESLGETRSRCAPYMRECTARELPNGDLLLVFTEQGVSTPGGRGLHRYAEVHSDQRGLRISVSATNGFDLPSEQWDVTRPDPVLTDAQLTAIATDPVWAFEVPATYGDAGADLAPYDDLDVPEEGDWVE